MWPFLKELWTGWREGLSKVSTALGGVLSRRQDQPYSYFFEARSCYLAQAGLFPCPSASECWDDSHVLPSPVSTSFNRLHHVQFKDMQEILIVPARSDTVATCGGPEMWLPPLRSRTLAQFVQSSSVKAWAASLAPGVSCTSIIPALGGYRQENQKLRVILNYTV